MDAGIRGDARQLAQIEVKVAPVQGGVVVQLASSMVRFLLLSMAWQSWPSLVHPRPVGGSTGEAGRCAGQIADMKKNAMRQRIDRSIYSHCCPGCWRLPAFLGCLPGGLAASCVAVL